MSSIAKIFFHQIIEDSTVLVFFFFHYTVLTDDNKAHISKVNQYMRQTFDTKDVDMSTFML